MCQSHVGSKYTQKRGCAIAMPNGLVPPRPLRSVPRVWPNQSFLLPRSLVAPCQILLIADASVAVRQVLSFAARAQQAHRVERARARIVEDAVDDAVVGVAR